MCCDGAARPRSAGEENGDEVRGNSIVLLRDGNAWNSPAMEWPGDALPCHGPEMLGRATEKRLYAQQWQGPVLNRRGMAR